MVVHVWFVRAVCSCGHLWTTQPNQSVQCVCRASCILDDGTLGGDAQTVTDEVAFKADVAADLRVDVNDLTVMAGEA